MYQGIMYQFPDGTGNRLEYIPWECPHPYYICYEEWEWNYDDPYCPYIKVKYKCRCIQCGYSPDEEDC